jgi:hypothetical protein
MDIFIYLAFPYGNLDCTVESATLRKLTELGVDLMLDIYSIADSFSR